MGCSTSIVKYLMFIFNLVFALAGLALLIVGVLFKLNVDEYTKPLNKIDANFALAPTLLIIVGSIVFVIAFFGCCGAVKESTCMLTTYAVILLTIFIFQVAVGVYAFLQVKNNPDELQGLIKKGLQETFNKYNTDEAAKESFWTLQHNLKCCGVVSEVDYRTIGAPVPASCCDNPATPTTCTSGFYSEGCSPKLWEFVNSKVQIVGGVAIGIAVTEIIGAIFALCLTSSIRNNERRGGYA